MTLDVKEIEQILPHRYPMLLVDRITDLEPGVRATGIKNVSYNEEFFRGHFPGEPVMPGVLILEAMAQVGGITMLSMPEYKGALALFGGIENVKFKRQVVPGDQLVMKATIGRIRGIFCQVHGECFVDDQLAAQGDFVVAMKVPEKK